MYQVYFKNDVVGYFNRSTNHYTGQSVVSHDFFAITNTYLNDAIRNNSEELLLITIERFKFVHCKYNPYLKNERPNVIPIKKYMEIFYPYFVKKYALFFEDWIKKIIFYSKLLDFLTLYVIL